jgi:hypothetical protein
MNTTPVLGRCRFPPTVPRVLMTCRRTAVAILAIAGVIVALPRAATAEQGRIDWKPAIAAAIGQGADVTSTMRFLSNGSRCVEGNAVYGQRPSAARLIAVKAPTVAAAALLAWRAAQPGAARWERRLARTFGYSAGIVGGGVAAWNIHGCGF